MATRSTPRWDRTGEPSTTFNGSSRPGHGSRGRGGNRGGRGAGRGNPRESKTTNGGNISPSKKDPPSVTINVSAISQPIPATSSDQTNASPVLSSKPKPSSRKPSRTIPSPLSVQVMEQGPAPKVEPSPISALTLNKRRRSQVGKPNGNNSSRANATPAKGVHNKANKSRLESGPTTSVKDTPPHLQHRLDVRQDIDALVERVRAVAMDNRPTTPGSHIDWASDDDDSLPDLNDWGVNTSTFASGSAGISPIILEGLKPLPDLPAPALASPLRQVVTLGGNSDDKVKDNLATSSRPSKRAIIGNTPTILKPVPEQDTSNQQLSQPPLSPVKDRSSVPPASTTQLNPSLPTKPAAPSIAPPSLHTRATHMRPHFYGKPSSSKETAQPKLSQKNDAVAQGIATSTYAALGPKSIDPTPLVLDLASPQEGPTRKGQDQSTMVESKSSSTSSDRSKSASLYTPKSEPVSTTPTAEISTHSRSPIHPQNRHWKERIPGRFYPQPRSVNGDHQGRSSAGRGRFHSPTHARNHSAPNVGSPNSHQRIRTSRPVITGDAISRINRAINAGALT